MRSILILFSFLVSFCGPCGPCSAAEGFLFLLGSASKSGLQFRTLAPVYVFSVFFWEPCHLHAALLYFISPFGFIRCSVGASNNFVCSLFA